MVLEVATDRVNRWIQSRGPKSSDDAARRRIEPALWKMNGQIIEATKRLDELRIQRFTVI